MGYREWRARQNERVDAWVGRADARAKDAQLKHEAVKAEVADRVEGDRESALREWMLSRADALHVDHDEMVARAERFGLGLPAPHQPRGLERVALETYKVTSKVPGATLLAAFNTEAMAADSMTTETTDPYAAWVNLIRAEERVAVHVDAGESVPAGDRALLRLSRWTFNHS